MTTNVYANEIAQLKTAHKAAMAKNSEGGRAEALKEVLRESIRLEGVLRGTVDYKDAKALTASADKAVRDLPTKGILASLGVTSFECDEGTAKLTSERYIDWVAFYRDHPQDLLEVLPGLLEGAKLNEEAITDPLTKERLEAYIGTKDGSLRYSH